MAEVPGTLEGWNVLHDFRRIDWTGLKSLSADERSPITDEAAAYLAETEICADPPTGDSALFTVVGHKADLLMLHLRPTVAELAEIEQGFGKTRFADFTSRPYSYLSVTELSLYEASARGGSENEEELRKNAFVQKRLYPEFPLMKYVCFYPMNKLRGETVNWYTEDMEERRRMMREHGSTGRKYHGQVQQMITGSMGLDDWEWGVTLFADDTLPIKKLVYEMRFDEVSAKYGEFGPFYMGIRTTPDELRALLMG